MLIDEAGQALPQAAGGALMRTKRAVVVGDPPQIEPVTSPPTELAETICHEFKVDPNRWNALIASVQTVADATSALGAEIPRDGEPIRVGACCSCKLLTSVIEVPECGQAIIIPIDPEFRRDLLLVDPDI
ncbi:MAG TPA: hypothetical protein VHG30_05385 [Microvirga sp.]|nr:hypothetical protein [Microvirga sp.]